MSENAKGWLWLIAIVIAMVVVGALSAHYNRPAYPAYETGCEGNYDRDGTLEC